MVAIGQIHFASLVSPTPDLMKLKRFSMHTDLGKEAFKRTKKRDRMVTSKFREPPQKLFFHLGNATSLTGKRLFTFGATFCLFHQTPITLHL